MMPPMKIPPATRREFLATSTAALASAFTEAFEAFQTRAWDDCVSMLEAILRSYPDDGPSRYFLSRALRFREAPKEAPAALIPRVGKA